MRSISLAAAMCLVASPLLAQATSHNVELSVGVSHFAQYVSSDDATRHTGPTVSLRFGSASGNSSVELAYTTVRQQSTNTSAAPQLDAVRLGFDWALPVDAGGRVAFVPSLGAAWLRVDAQEIDCGVFPLCSERAPYDASLAAGVVGMGLRGQLGERFTLRAAGLGYLPLGSWQPDGWQSLLELRLTIGARF